MKQKTKEPRFVQNIKLTKNKIKTKLTTIKPFFRTHKSEFTRTTIILILLIAIYFLSMIMFQFRGNYAEQIIMETNPQYTKLLLREGEREKITINTEIRANLFCQVTCNYQFKDLSTNKIIINETFFFHNYKKHEFNYEFLVDKLGSGQEIYLYQMSCTNQESRFCSASTFPITRFSTITLNYLPSLEQELLKEEVDQILQELENIFLYGKSINTANDQKINNLQHMRTTHLFNELLKIKFYETIISKEFDKINTNLATQNYTLIQNHLTNNNILERFMYFKEEINTFDEFINQEIKTYNQIITQTKEFKENNKIKKLETARLLNPENFLEPNTNQDTAFNYTYNDLIRKQNNLINTINTDNFLTYTSLREELHLIKNETEHLEQNINNYLDEIFEKETQFLELYVWRSLIEKEICLIKNCTYNEEELYDYLRKINRTNIKEETNNICQEINNLKETYYETLNQQINKRINLTPEEIKITDNQHTQKILNILHELKTEPKITQIINKYEEKITHNETNHTETTTAYLIGKHTTQQTNYFFEICTPHQINQLNLEQEEIIEIKPTIINMTLIQQVTPQCCYAEKCKPCCDYEECKETQQNPLLVIHGYSFYSFNSALHSTNAFVDFSKHLLQENLYYPAGIIGPYFYEEYAPSDLSRNHVPPLFFGTYYNVVRFGEITPGEFNIKSQSLTDYADELNNLINIITKATNKTKIDIVAHSMGGIVLREYLTKYTDEKIDKIILIGTPNHGVPPRLVYLCKFFGGQIECDEMHQKSTFIEQLNQKEPPQQEIHMIIGEGCNTFGEDGDGIVQTKSAILPFATNHHFKGNCNIVENFHRDMIKPTHYEEIYELVKTILLE